MSDSEDPVVLIVEDEPDVAETYRLWLEENYEVRMAQNGDVGLEKLDSTVDVVLLAVPDRSTRRGCRSE